MLFKTFLAFALPPTTPLCTFLKQNKHGNLLCIWWTTHRVPEANKMGWSDSGSLGASQRKFSVNWSHCLPPQQAFCICFSALWSCCSNALAITRSGWPPSPPVHWSVEAFMSCLSEPSEIFAAFWGATLRDPIRKPGRRNKSWRIFKLRGLVHHLYRGKTNWDRLW